ncbi:LOW QUALITY PROTEIN: Hypothetical protein PHPALM_14127 [Phytophthora palmivora]|uniref:Uncharacterized protein n=1 Tax=Phytophthora palmivora TaxID=4796 RepID=A0A2P4XVJ2_9STRA|nr:LOW QUALITY PROTEIN: Hypothetical protein PHPALM_14127 [Phytophthora palmivora]
MNVNTFRTRYADTVAINLLPGLVVGQILIMGVMSLYQVMSHKRSVLLTQIWAYRSQNGRMQVVYLAQIIVHLIFYSGLYMLGLATGTLTDESIANLTCCCFAFSYSFINLVKARSGDQKLWSPQPVWASFCFPYNERQLLLSSQKTPKSCAKRQRVVQSLNDFCVLNAAHGQYAYRYGYCFNWLSWIVPFITAKMSRKNHAVRSVRLSLATLVTSRTASKIVVSNSTDNMHVVYKTENDNLTSFERNCLGSSFHRLFHDCDDIAYVVYNENDALLLTGYLYYGEHIYEASSVLLLLVARLVPSKILQTFNVLLLRWRVDPKDGTLSQAMACTWYTASSEQHKLAAATPVA